MLCAYCLYVLLAAVASELTFISTSPIPKPRVFEEETDVSGHRLCVWHLGFQLQGSRVPSMCMVLLGACWNNHITYG